MELNLTLKPGQLELIAKPGATVTQTYTVTNNSSSSVIVSTSVLTWTPQGSNGSVSYDNVSPNPNFEFSLNNSDLKLGQSFLLPAGQSHQLVLKIHSLPEAPLTDGYFTFFVSQDFSSSLNPDGAQAAVSGRLGSHILISTSNSETVPATSKIVRFKSSYKLVDSFFPRLRFTGLVENSGDYFFKTVGKITVTKGDLQFQSLDLFPYNVLAQQSRQISCNSGNQPVDCAISPPYWPGVYTATLQLDPTLGSSATSTTFFCFPFSFTLLIGLILIIARVFYFYGKKHSKQL